MHNVDGYEHLNTEQESFEILEQARQVVTEGLRLAMEVHSSLGKRGEESLETNQFGDTALRVDIEIEKAILDYFRHAQLPIKVISEEHGTTMISEEPKLLAIMDGLDGSSVYKEKRNWGRYGTMLGIFSGLDPLYSDYLVSGIAIHSPSELLIAAKSKGVEFTNNTGQYPVHASGQTELNQHTRIRIDEYFEENRELFSENLQGFNTSCDGSSSISYADVARGEADLALECTRKSNLEIAIAYGLEREAGAVMVDIDGQDLGVQKYQEFGQAKKVSVVTAATPELAIALINHINRNRNT